MITLDPDFPCYDIVEVRDRDHFTFAYYAETNLPAETTVHCFEYSELRGEFNAKLISEFTYEATRIL